MGFTVFFSVHRTAPINIVTKYLLKFNTSTVRRWYCIVSYRLVLVIYLSCKKIYYIRFRTRWRVLFSQFAILFKCEKYQTQKNQFFFPLLLLHFLVRLFLWFHSIADLNCGHTLTELEYAHFMSAHCVTNNPTKKIGFFFWWSFRLFSLFHTLWTMYALCFRINNA